MFQILHWTSLQMLIDRLLRYFSHSNFKTFFSMILFKDFVLAGFWIRIIFLQKLDTSLKIHENRAALLCLTAEKLAADSEESKTRNYLHESADELHLVMESARGVLDRRRTRLTSWLATCSTLESAMLMNREGEEVAGEQTLPVWIATIRQRLQFSGPNISSPIFQKEIVNGWPWVWAWLHGWEWLISCSNSS